MKIYKFLQCLLIFLFLCNCYQSTAMVGPAVTLASTGNIYQASFSYGANQAVEKETGMSATEYVSTIIKEPHKKEKNKLDEDLFVLVKSNFEKTRQIILKQSKQN